MEQRPELNRDKHMKQDRFLLAILGGISVLVIAALILFFARQGILEYGSDNTPESVIRNYILALENEDFSRAYNYLSEEERPEYEGFLQVFIGTDPTRQRTSVRIGEAHPAGDRTLVDLTLIHQSSAPFQDAYYEETTASLVKEGDRWVIVQMPYPYWNWDWGQKPLQ
jgi:hypothetical protein